jgi:hypothetical protein
MMPDPQVPEGAKPEEPEMAKFYTLTADYGRLLQIGGRSFKVGTAPSKPIRLTPSQISQVEGAGVTATPADVTTESRPMAVDGDAPKVFPPPAEKSGKFLDPSSIGRGTRPGPMIPPVLEREAAETDLLAPVKE